MKQTKRRPGRPPVERRRIQMAMRITPELRDELVARADASGRSLTQQLEMLFEAGLTLEKLIGTSLKVMVNVITAFNANGEARARELGVEGDWTLNEDCYKSAAYAAFRDLLELSPPPWDGQYWHLMF